MVERVSHETLAADIATLRAEVAQIRVGDANHRADIASINGRLAAGQAAFSEIKTLIGGMSWRLDELKTAQEKDRDEVKALIAAENQRRGRDGVWAAILRSPFFAWMTAAGAGIAAALQWIGGKSP